MNYKETYEKAKKHLTDNPEWEERYGKYYQAIKPGKQANYISTCVKCFNPKAMTKYLTIGDAKNSKGTVLIDLRYLGHSIGRIKVKLTSEVKNAIDNKSDNFSSLVQSAASLSFTQSGFNKIMPKLNEEDKKKLADTRDVLCRENSEWEWHSEEVSKLRKILNNISDYTIITEHTVESFMLKQLRKHKSEDKNIIGIQPCLLDNCFYQLCTPLTASNAKSDDINYSSGNGGGIDILARIKVNKSNKQELCVIELKDEYKTDERPIKAIKQAISYATFLDALIRSDKACGAGWYKEMFGVTSPNSSLDKPITINAVAAMPFQSDDSVISDEDKELAGKEIILENGDIIKLHYMFFKKEALNSKEFVPGGIVSSLPVEHR